MWMTANDNQLHKRRPGESAGIPQDAPKRTYIYAASVLTQAE
jgi:hypothetical protein